MNLLTIILIFLNFGFGPEQSELPKNEAGLIQFEEEILIENLSKEDLYKNALIYISSLNKENKRKSDININHENKIVEKKGSFLVYTNGLLTPQIHGEITYKVKIKVFEDRYKYTFSDFVFNYYKRNRYGRYAPVNGKTKRLEEEKFVGMQKIWESHKASTRDHIENQIKYLKSIMTEQAHGTRTVLHFEKEDDFND